MKMIRNFHNRCINYSKIVPNNLKGKSVSSQQWLTRQLNDPYIERARQQNYRCRSAFKLLEIDKKYNIIKPGNVCIDCGAAPGSWTQIAIDKSNANHLQKSKSKGYVIGIDLLQIYPIEGAVLLGNTDFTQKTTQDKIRQLLNGRSIDVVLSDMAPKATGVRCLDQENITKLCYSVLRFAIQMSTVNASLLMKIWDNADVKQLELDILKFYATVKSIKPVASRGDSAEKFLLARDFIGLEKLENNKLL